MEIKDAKQAQEFLLQVTQDETILDFIENELQAWDFQDSNNSLDVHNINQLFTELNQEIFKENQTDCNIEALHWFVFERIHDICVPLLKQQFSEKDTIFFEKCKMLSMADVSAQHFGADENYNIPLAAAVVELSVLDRYRTPSEKMSCLCGAFDLVFAEIKTAMVDVISQNSEKENEIPVIDNRDVIPVLMVVVIKSRLAHMFTNLFYIKYFDFMRDKGQINRKILESFEKAIDAIMKINLVDLQPVSKKVLKDIDLEEYMKITSSEDTLNRTLVDEANRRALNLISKATDEQ